MSIFNQNEQVYCDDFRHNYGFISYIEIVPNLKFLSICRYSSKVCEGKAFHSSPLGERSVLLHCPFANEKIGK